MKIPRLLTAACAASAILFAACDNKGGGSGGATSEKEALDAFKAKVEEIKQLSKAGEAESQGNPMGGMGKLKQIMAKVAEIKTDGLPADLKEAFTVAQSKMAGMAEIFKDMPEKQEEMMAWMMKLGTDPAIKEKMETLQKEGDAAFEKLKEVGKKYGIEDFGMSKK